MATGFGFCDTCGTPRGVADQSFCAGCGSALSPAAAAPPPVPPAPIAPPPVAPTAWSVPPGPAYPPTYPAGPPPAYTGSPLFAVSSARAGTGGGFKMLRRVVTILGVLVIAALVVVSYLGVAQVPVLSSAFGMDHARDLHMVKDGAALKTFTDKWGIELPSPTQNYTLGSKHHYSGSVQVDDTISEGALAALPEYGAPNKTISQIQFRIHEGSMEMSAFVNVRGYPATGPVYAQFSVSATSRRTVAVDFSHVEFGRVGVPGNVVDTVKSALEASLNKKILEAGITIDKLELHEGGIRFQGTWPKTITADSPAGLP